MTRTLYEILELPLTASRAEIEAACSAFGERYRPESNFADITAHERFAEIERAYATLTDASKRAEADASSIPAALPSASWDIPARLRASLSRAAITLSGRISSLEMARLRDS